MVRPPRGGPLLPELDGVVLAEARATRAGSRVAKLAQANGLFMSHFEHTAWLPLPEAWEPADRPDLGEVSGWAGGVLPETKFRHFRLDRMVGSYHPGQRSKWTAHELAHKLVGWAWWPGMSILELATVARVAEALPVALWYFFDEADRRRCALHLEVDAWGAGLCRDCEAAAMAGPTAGTDESVLAAGLRFVERELAAAEAALATGRPHPTPWRTVDLSSDGFAWAAAHGPRLRDPAFGAWIEGFVPPGQGRWCSAAALIHRVREATAALVDGGSLSTWAGAGDDWMLQDVSARVLQVRVETEGEAAVEMDHLLAEAAADRDIDALADGYTLACHEWELPAADDVFGVGYSLGKCGFGLRPTHLEAALRSAMPRSTQHLRKGWAAFVEAFATGDRWQRLPFVRRLQAAVPPISGSIGALIALEVALADLPPVDLVALTLAGEVDADGPLALGRVEVVHAPAGWDRTLAGGPLQSGSPVAVAVVQGADGGAVAVELSAAAAAACVRMANGATAVHDVALEERTALIAAGIWVAGLAR